MADDPVGQRSRQPQPLPAKRQIRGPALSSRQIARRTHDLETTVQHERMDIQPVLGQSFRQRHLAQRLTRAGPDPPKRAKGRTQIDSSARPVAIIARYVHRRQAGLETIQIDPLTHFQVGGSRRQTTFHVDRPLPFAPLAEDLDTARRRRLGSIQHNLDLPPLVTRLVFVLFEDQRVVKLHVFHDHGPTLFEERRRTRHGPIECAGCHDPTEHPVVDHPRRISGKHFRLEGDLAAGGFVPGTQQRVAGASAPPSRQLDPVSLALERIAGQRDPSPRLP